MGLRNHRVHGMKELVIKPSRVLLGVCMRGEGSSITHLHNSMTMNILAIKTASIYIVLYIHACPTHILMIAHCHLIVSCKR